MKLDTNYVSVLFELDELWLLHKCIRHELPSVEHMKYPPCDIELNDKIAEAVLFCHINEINQAYLAVSLSELLALDYTVPQDAKNVAGKLLGKNILLKTFLARKQLKGDEYLSSVGDEKTLPKDEINEIMTTLATKPIRKRTKKGI